MSQRLQILIKGQVQGVGFRPYIYRLAKQFNLSGWVKNNGAGVLIEIQGQSTNKFINAVSRHLPRLAMIENIETNIVPNKLNESDFSIIPSEISEVTAKITPDVAICDLCLQELFDETSRFYLYPFLNCTYCGPRFTITQQLPYDRAFTTMSNFIMCEKCDQEYHNPTNRRYHAQPTACAQCGPQLSESIARIAHEIKTGNIIAIKSLGGYQLICDANNTSVIAKLRQRKNRAAKPFAIMLLNTASVKHYVECSEKAEQLLNDWMRPIVLLKRKNPLLPDIIAPHLDYLGVMLPSTPLHYLIFHALAGFPGHQSWLNELQNITLIVTSANVSHNPLVMDDTKANAELANIADKIVSYNRKILTRVDDSVMGIINDNSYFIRRARGYVPTPIKLAYKTPAILALGAHLKNTFCLTRGEEAFVSQHIGDLDNRETIEFFHESLQRLEILLNIKPNYVAHDLHPDFYTTQLAKTYHLPSFAIQHHHAHLAAVAAEYHIQKPVLGLALDGYGYGDDGAVWGGELMELNGGYYQRLANFNYIPLPGGDKAAQEPWRMAVSILCLLNREQEIPQRFSNKDVSLLIEMIKRKINTPFTSSCGRLFDAASALLNVQNYNHYEGQAAMQLESLVSKLQVLPNGFKIEKNNLNFLPLFNYLADCKDKNLGANIFHGTLNAALTAWLIQWTEQTKIKTILLSGGCFLNRILTENLINILKKHHLTPLFPTKLPPNDGGLCLGQAWIASQLIQEGFQTKKLEVCDVSRHSSTNN